MARFHKIRGTYKQFSAVALCDDVPDSILKPGAEVPDVFRIDPAVHKPEAVRGADNRVAGNFEDRSVVNLNKVQVATEVRPSAGKSLVDGREHELHTDSVTQVPDALPQTQPLQI